MMNGPSAAERKRLETMLVAGYDDGAELFARRLIRRYPAHRAGWEALSAILVQRGDAEGALAAIEKLESLAPSDPQVLLHAAKVHGMFGRLDEAERRFQAAARLTPDMPEARYALGQLAYRQMRFDEAERYFREALDVEPRHEMAWFYRGVSLFFLGRVRAAESCFRRYIELNPRSVSALPQLGLSLLAQRRQDEGEASLREALKIADVWLPLVHSDLLLGMNYAEAPPERYLEEARSYGRAASRAAAGRSFRSWARVSADARLRVGVVSGNLREHPEVYFLEPLLRHVDRARIALYAYPNEHARDGTTDRVQAQFDAWTPITGLDDADAAQRIHGDCIQVLIDLSGHTNRNRAGVFAYRPAPVQVSWLGYFASTGIAEIDWFVADPISVPEGHEFHFTERIWRLPDTRLCFAAPEVPIEPGGLPALDHGFVTFCCFSTPAKFSDRVFEAMARILAGVPSSRLFLKARQLQEDAACDELRQRFLALGIDGDRLMLEGPSRRAEYLACYRKADIGLDTFPFTGGTTTAESLWMGVPVVTFAGDRLVARQGASLMTSAGLSDWVAADADGYVDIAIRRARDLPGLAGLRAGLRGQVLASPLFDGARFARHFEQALFGMLDEYSKRAAIP